MLVPVGAIKMVAPRDVQDDGAVRNKTKEILRSTRDQFKGIDLK